LTSVPEVKEEGMAKEKTWGGTPPRKKKEEELKRGGGGSIRTARINLRDQTRVIKYGRQAQEERDERLNHMPLNESNKVTAGKIMAAGIITLMK